MPQQKNKMSNKSDSYNFCRINGFLLREYPLEGRLSVVILKRKIFIKNSLDEERKRLLVKKAVSHLLIHLDCQLTIFWEGKELFFHL